MRDACGSSTLNEMSTVVSLLFLFSLVLVLLLFLLFISYAIYPQTSFSLAFSFY